MTTLKPRAADASGRYLATSYAHDNARTSRRWSETNDINTNIAYSAPSVALLCPRIGPAAPFGGFFGAMFIVDVTITTTNAIAAKRCLKHRLPATLGRSASRRTTPATSPAPAERGGMRKPDAREWKHEGLLLLLVLAVALVTPPFFDQPPLNWLSALFVALHVISRAAKYVSRPRAKVAAN